MGFLLLWRIGLYLQFRFRAGGGLGQERPAGSQLPVWANAHLAVALAHLGESADANDAVAHLLARKPDFSCAFATKKLFYIKRTEQLALYLDGLRKAGVPENSE